MAITHVTTPERDDTDSRKAVRRIAYTKDALEDDWGFVHYLEPVSWRKRSAPGVSQATLLFREGAMMREQKTSSENYQSDDLIGKFVKIAIQPKDKGRTQIWAGVIETDSNNVQGKSTVPQGDRSFTAYGIEHLLDREGIFTARVEQEGAVITVDRVPRFNARNELGNAYLGNRSTAIPDGEDAHVFSDDGAVWTNRDIVDYILANHQPSGVTFKLTGQPDILNNIEAIHDLNGQTVKSWLDHLVDRNRGMGWYCKWVGSDNPEIWIFSLADEDVEVGDVTIAGNPFKGSLDVTTDNSVADVNILRESERADKIVVRGERLKVCASFDIESGTLVNDWSVEEEEAYLAVSGGSADANDEEWKGEKYKRVYSDFAISDPWTGLSASGSNALPFLDDNGEIDIEQVAAFWRTDQSFLRYLPLGKNWNWASVPDRDVEFMKPMVLVSQGTFDPENWGGERISVDGNAFAAEISTNYLVTGTDGAAVVRLPEITEEIHGKGVGVFLETDDFGLRVEDSSQAELLAVAEPFEGGLFTANFDEAGASWVVEEKTARAYKLAEQSEGDDDRPAASVSLLENKLGFHVDFPLPHQMAEGVDGIAGLAISNKSPVYDPSLVIVTGFFETDQHAEVIHLRAGAPDNPKVETITVAGAEMWYVVPQTVIGVTNTFPVTHIGGLVRDDSETLRIIAQLMANWYAQKRASISVVYDHLRSVPDIGTYITTISSGGAVKQVGTTITEIVWNAGTNPNNPGTTTVKTGFWDVDFSGILNVRAEFDAQEKAQRRAAEAATFREFDRISGEGTRQFRRHLLEEELALAKILPDNEAIMAEGVKEYKLFLAGLFPLMRGAHQEENFPGLSSAADFARQFLDLRLRFEALQKQLGGIPVRTPPGGAGSGSTGSAVAADRLQVWNEGAGIEEPE